MTASASIFAMLLPGAGLQANAGTADGDAPTDAGGFEAILAAAMPGSVGGEPERGRSHAKPVAAEKSPRQAGSEPEGEATDASQSFALPVLTPGVIVAGAQIITRGGEGAASPPPAASVRALVTALQSAASSPAPAAVEAPSVKTASDQAPALPPQASPEAPSAQPHSAPDATPGMRRIPPESLAGLSQAGAEPASAATGPAPVKPNGAAADPANTTPAAKPADAKAVLAETGKTDLARPSVATPQTPAPAPPDLSAQPSRAAAIDAARRGEVPPEQSPLQAAPPAKVFVTQPAPAPVATQPTALAPAAQPVIEAPPAALAASSDVGAAEVVADARPEVIAVQTAGLAKPAPPAGGGADVPIDPRTVRVRISAEPVPETAPPAHALGLRAAAAPAATASEPAAIDLSAGQAEAPAAPIDDEAPAQEAHAAAPDEAEAGAVPAHVPPGHAVAAANQLKAALHTMTHLAAQIVSKVAGKSTQFEVGLDPIGLGHVNVQLQIDAAGALTAALSFDNPQAAAELRARAAELHRALTDAGFDLAEGALSFDVAADSGQGQGRQSAWDLSDLGERGLRAMTAFAEDNAPTAAHLAAALRRAAGGLDIRI